MLPGTLDGLVMLRHGILPEIVSGKDYLSLPYSGRPEKGYSRFSPILSQAALSPSNNGGMLTAHGVSKAQWI